MNMLHGKVIVEAPDGDEDRTGDYGEEFAEAVGVGPARAVSERSWAHFSLLGSLTSLPTSVVGIEDPARAPGGDGSEVGRPGRTALTEWR
jgi:hypothetical protein